MGKDARLVSGIDGGSSRYRALVEPEYDAADRATTMARRGLGLAEPWS
jgi:hypothetical protein